MQKQSKSIVKLKEMTKSKSILGKVFYYPDPAGYGFHQAKVITWHPGDWYGIKLLQSGQVIYLPEKDLRSFDLLEESAKKAIGQQAY